MEALPPEKLLGGIDLETRNGGGCDHRNGMLPSCAPLARAYVPMQQSSAPQYDPSDALKRGTLFPGLDLPFMNMVNMEDVSGTPLGEVMALCFVSHELQLYLDTHPDDIDAFKLMKSAMNLTSEAKRRYIAKYGPLRPDDMLCSDTFDWIDDPWPWMYQQRGE